MQLMVQLVDLHSRLPQGFPSRRRDAIEASRAAAGLTRQCSKQAGALHPVEQRVQRARPNAVAMMRELFHHRQAEDRLMARVQQHVNADQAVKQFALVTFHWRHYTAVYTTFP